MHVLLQVACQNFAVAPGNKCEELAKTLLLKVAALPYNFRR